MFDAIATLLSWFYDLVPNYAFAIAALTLLVMIVLTPLTLKGTRSMMAMQRLQPEIKRLQQEYKGDRQKLNEELMKFYQANKINPLGGCLPLLLQMPVFLVLFRVLSGLTRTGPDGNFDPSYLDPNSQLYQDLSSTDQMMSFGMNLADSAARAVSDSIVRGIPYLIMVLLVAGTSYYQQRQITVRNTKHGMAQPANPQQQMLLKLLPAFFAVISLTLPAGIVVYFLVSNVYRIGQQGFISRSMAKEAVAGSVPGEPKAHKAEGGTTTIEATATEPEADAPPPKPAPKAKPTPPPAADSKKKTTPPKGRPTPSPKQSGSGGSRPPSGRVTPPGGSTTRRRKRK